MCLTVKGNTNTKKKNKKMKIENTYILTTKSVCLTAKGHKNTMKQKKKTLTAASHACFQATLSSSFSALRTNTRPGM